MSQLSRYLMRELSLFILFALIGLLGLYTFFDLIAELGDLGVGGYGLKDALIYVALRSPANAYELLPIAVLIGGIFGLSHLSGSSELTVMRASGVSLRRLLLWLCLIGTFYATLTLLLGEYISPAGNRMANQHRLAATQSMLVGDFRSGVWIKDGKQIVNIAEMLPDLTVVHARIYEFGQTLTLEKIIEGHNGRFQSKGNWTLQKATITQFLPEHAGVVLSKPTTFNWQTSISPAMLAVLLVEPAQMSATSLMSYVEHLKRNKQKTSRYELALWGKLFYPLACLSMVLIALPFAQSQRRSGNAGVRIFIGIACGLVFHFLNQIVVYLGDLYSWPPPIVVSIPTLLFLSAAALMLWRQERR
ncbi:LPS export ABC transporter permease LptG [Iodobacter sp. CM08]|uniref:LPS export ABC transporter permease LptG n=1 Tax=Iodobacter sp. CM08 TaxID=3085902 RepID=UPI002980B18E|nr:LPS export ABC transporter permease LptG [Iodobacter sp. CM08]MDW5417792.1 LPS export ABC transporter permease LptG [Iodobacter sp. CM08]